MSAPGSQPRAIDVIVGGGFAAGVVDILNAIVFWRLYSGTSATVILQSVAAGVQGKTGFAGVAYGLLTWIAMNYVIVPLSRASSPPFIMSWFIDGFLAHVFLVGLLFAFVARWSAARRTQA